MSKYAIYAKRLDAAFKDARKQYTDAYNAVKEAEKGVEDTKNERDKFYIGEADLLREERTTALHRAEAAFRIVEEKIWPAFDVVRDELTEALKKSVQAGSTAAPEDIDANGLTLLQSGILRVDELEGLIDRYEDNTTMTRIIGQHCKAAAEKERDPEKRRRLTAIARRANEGLSGFLASWDGLLEAVRVCSGRNRGEAKPDPSFVVSISKQWERLTEGTVESF